MLLDTPSTLSEPTPAVVISDDDGQTASNVEQPTNEPPQLTADAETPQVSKDEPAKPSEISEADRRFWAQCDVMAKLAECNRNIKASEEVIEDYKASIKEEKDLLKGEQIRLQRLASELADIIEGRPLPKNPHAKKEEVKKSNNQQASESSDDQDEYAWRDKPTDELLQGVKGMGDKKVEAIMELAPTAGHLEDLRGEASKAHMSFKEKLPKGFGQSLSDAIEDKLIQLVASCAKSAEQQAAEERVNAEADGETLNFDKTVIEIRERLEIERSKDGVTQNDFIPEDLSDRSDPFVDGWHSFNEKIPLEKVSGILNEKDWTNPNDVKSWLTGYLTSQMVVNWNPDKSE